MRKPQLLVIGAILLAVLAGQSAIAATISGTLLSGGGQTKFDPAVQVPAYCEDPLAYTSVPAYTPVTDGATDVSDGFDDGLTLFVNGSAFDDLDGQGTLS